MHEFVPGRISIEGYPEELQGADGDSVLDELSEAADSECAQSDEEADVLQSARASLRYSLASFHSTDEDGCQNCHGQVMDHKNGMSEATRSGKAADMQHEPLLLHADRTGSSAPPDDGAPSVSSFQQHVSCSTILQNFEDDEGRSRGFPSVSSVSPMNRMSTSPGTSHIADVDLSASLNEKVSFVGDGNSPVQGRAFSGEVQIMSTPERTMSQEQCRDDPALNGHPDEAPLVNNLSPRGSSGSCASATSSGGHSCDEPDSRSSSAERQPPDNGLHKHGNSAVKGSTGAGVMVVEKKFELRECFE